MQQINTYNTTEGIIDLHNHTNYSASNEDYMKLNLFPKDLLEETLNFSNKFNCPVTFSTTDHNNILGTKEIYNIINNNPEKYKKINYITGCEFSVSCVSLGNYKNYNKETKSVFHSLHLLGYNFNVNDKTLNYYSKLKSIGEGEYFCKYNIHYPLGAIVIAGKKFLNNQGYKFPLSYFTNFELIKSSRGSKKNFIENVKNFCTYCKNNFSIKEKIIEDMSLYLLGLPKDYFSKKKKSKHFNINEEDIDYYNVVSNSKLDIMEMMSIIENAGGVSVLAHPNLIRLHETFLKNSKKYAKNQFYRFIPKKRKKDEINLNDFISQNIKIKAEMFDYIINTLANKANDPVTNKKLNGIVGLELLHSSNMSKEYFEILCDLAEKYNLYTTGGSDKHGDYFKNTLSIGQIMPLNIEEKFTKKDIKQVIFSIKNCKFIEDILNKRKLERKSGNNDIKILVKTPRRVSVFDLDTIKKFVKKFSRSNFHYLFNKSKNQENEQNF